MDTDDPLDQAFIAGVTCIAVGAVILIVAVILLLCYCKYNRKIREQKKAVMKEQQIQRHLQEYFIRTGGAPDDYLQYGTGTSWGGQSTRSSDKSLTRHPHEGNSREERQQAARSDREVSLNVADFML